MVDGDADIRKQQRGSIRSCPRYVHGKELIIIRHTVPWLYHPLLCGKYTLVMDVYASEVESPLS